MNNNGTDHQPAHPREEVHVDNLATRKTIWYSRKKKYFVVTFCTGKVSKILTLCCVLITMYFANFEGEINPYYRISCIIMKEP